MKTRSLALMLAALALLPTATSAQTSISVAGGLSIPVGTLGDVTDIGYAASAGLNLGAPIVPVGARLEGTFASMGTTRGSGDVRIIAGTANAIFNISPSREAPYVIAGLGAYNRRSSTTLGTLTATDSRTVVGINGGAGLRFPLTGLSTYFEARYHLMLGKADEGTNYSFIPITFGITF
jgi:hypothetical protein